MEGVREIIQRLDKLGSRTVKSCERGKCGCHGSWHGRAEFCEQREEFVAKLGGGRKSERRKEGVGQVLDEAGLVKEMGRESGVSGDKSVVVSEIAWCWSKGYLPRSASFDSRL